MAPSKRTVAARATIDLNHVATWVRVVETGSFTAAAAELRVPKSSVSRAVQRLEAALGVALLQRSTRKLTLTGAGGRYLTTAREALRILHEGQADALNDAQALQGLVRITMPPDNGVLGRALSDALMKLRAQHAGLRFELIVTGSRVDLLAENVDLALRAGTLNTSDLVAKKLFASTLVLVAAPSYLRSRGVPKRLSDLEGHDFIVFRGNDGVQRLRLTGPSGIESVDVRGPVRVDDMLVQLPLAEHGAGIALLPERAVEAAIAARRLDRVLPTYSRSDTALYLVSAARAAMPRRVQVTRDHLFEHLSRDLAACGR